MTGSVLSIREILALTLSISALCAMPAWADAATYVVNDDTTGPGPSGADCVNPDFATIQAAINAADAAPPRDTIQICAGSYAESLTVPKSLKFLGAQAGVDARGRSATESTIAPAAGTTAMVLQPGSAGSAIDGLTLSGGLRGIESSNAGGPLDGVSISNNRIVGFTGAGIFLNDPGVDITVDRNVVDGGSKLGAGDLVHLDVDPSYNGFQLTNNNIVNGAMANGFFVDGNHNVGMSASRPPSLSGNLIQANQAGVNLGTRAFQFGNISGNTFAGNTFDGVQGGIQNSTISGNTFTGNGRSGLSLTSFGNMGADRGAQNDLVTGNTFTGNGVVNNGEAIFFSNSQAAGTIATNQTHFNRISGNNRGTTYNGTEAIDLQNNWWGCNGGPGGLGCDTKNGTGAAGVDTDPWLVLGVSANPTTIQVGGQTSQIAADLTRNSDGALAGPGFPVGTSVGFATTLGTILTPGLTSGGVATSTLTSGTTPGAAAVSASLDNATAMVAVTIQAAAQPPTAQPPKKKCKKKKKRATSSKKRCKKKAK